MGGIFNHGNITLFGRSQNRIHVGTLAKQVYGYDRLGLGPNLGRHLIGPQVVTTLGTVHEDWHASQPRHRSSRSEKGKGWANYLIPWTNPHRLQGQKKCIGSIGNSNRMRDPNPITDLMFKSLHFRP
ncbi:MAG TPA: hypothetical protein DIT30_05525 [Verrucomicrobiales bacterium]|nr:hypothetical protein [Verrucomicrobiales bacterium]